MSYPTTNPGDSSRKINRRNMLRNSAITAAGAVLLPSFMTGCRKPWDFPHGHGGHGGHGGGGVGGVELTPDQLKQAADNLMVLRQCVNDAYQLAEQYDNQVFNLLNSTKTSSWANFDADIMIDIAFLMAAALSVASGGAAAVPAIAFFSAMLHDWGIGKDRPNNLVDNFVEFELGRIAMQSAIQDSLSHLADPGDNYSNLRAKGQDPIVFNGDTYTLEDLANKPFTIGDEYNRLKDASYIHMKQAVWNLLIMKCCSYYKADDGWVTLKGDSYNSLVFYVRENVYAQHKGVYVRGYMYELLPGDSGTFWIDIWNLGIDGYPFPDLACQELFIDDTPNHTINDKGLFKRDYVFKQFSLTKPNFGDNRHELGDYADSSFSYNDDWDFTGGMFPKLIK